MCGKDWRVLYICRKKLKQNNWVNKKEKLHLDLNQKFLWKSSSLSSLTSGDCSDFLSNRHKLFKTVCSQWSLLWDSKAFVQFSSLQLTFKSSINAFKNHTTAVVGNFRNIFQH